MAQQTATAVKQKKRWFTVLAPEVFGSREIADLPAFNAEDLKGRIVEVPGNMLTGSPKDNIRKYKLVISELKGDKAVTSPQFYYIVESFIQRSARKYKERFISVLNLETQDGKKARAKLQFWCIKKLHHPVRAEILHKSVELVKSIVKEMESSKIFDPAYLEKIGNDLRKSLADVYPIDKIVVAKLGIKA